MRAIKSMVGLFLVLAIQLLQVQSGLASVADSSCATDTHSPCCCSGADHCPCARSAPEKESNVPLSSIPSDIKAQDFIKPASETLVLVDPVRFPSEVRAPVACGQLPIGFGGVSLSVAFCRFII
ncbi:MAG: hypothetical protein CFE26_14745 [Verrucomicrobiales bacterium VVV1]|nr:MAG: hypothetical protein CFE26_14745 [Verrucomicrobiales bacterium VVV1]